MQKRWGLLILATFLLTACGASQYAKKDVDVPFKQVKQVRVQGAFSQIKAQGHLNLTLHTGYRQPKVVLSGDARDLAQITTHVTDDTLHVLVGKGYPRYGMVHADIQTKTLTRVQYEGAGVVKGLRLNTNYLDLSLNTTGTVRLGGRIGLRHLHAMGSGLVQISGLASPNLSIRLQGEPKVQLTGHANLTHLEAQGGGTLSFYWLKSDFLILRASHLAKLQLAGVVNKLDVELWGNAQLKGRYLRAERSFVKTHQHAVAEISSVNHQSTLALGASNIYYYNLPTTRADFMAYDGSVLDMREWERFEMQYLNRYNKQFP